MPPDDPSERITVALSDPINAGKPNRLLARELGVHESLIRRVKSRMHPPMTTEEIAISDISMTADTQQRVGIDGPTVDRYREVLQAGGWFASNPIVFRDPKSNVMHLGGGLHRLTACQREGRATITADIRPGTLRDAILFSCGDNAHHGKPRTPDDARKAIRTMLADAEWGRWPDGRIADACKVSASTVARARKEVEAETGERPARTVERNGITYDQKPREPKPKVEPNDGVTNYDRAAESAAKADPSSSGDDDGSLAPRVMDDAEWIEGVNPKVRKKLAPHCRDLFDSEALLYRRLLEVPEWAAVARKLKAILELKKSDKRRGPIHSFYRRLLALKPDGCTYCSKCDGSGVVGPNSCGACYGAGFLLA